MGEGRITVKEIRSVLAAVGVLARFGLEATWRGIIPDLRAMYGMAHAGVRSYIEDILGDPLVRLPAKQFKLYADYGRNTLIQVAPDSANLTLVDYLCVYFDYRHLPAVVERVEDGRVSLL